MKGAQDFLALFKKETMKKINMKKFFPLKVRTSIKTSSLPKYLALYAEVF